MSNFRVVLDKSLIKVTEIEKRLEVFEFPELRPVCDTREFGRVHFNLVIGDDDTEVVNG